MEGARDFLDAVAFDFETNKPPIKFDRERYLVALPILGTGGGGAARYCKYAAPANVIP